MEILMVAMKVDWRAELKVLSTVARKVQPSDAPEVAW